MGLFGKKKTPEEILAEGRALYEQGKYGNACFVLFKASGKEEGEVDYWLGRCYLAMDERDGKSPGWSARQFLKFAAEAGHGEAAQLLAEKFGIRDYLSQDAASQPEPETEPQPVPDQKTAG